jgi:hypothetical protein
VRDVDLERRKFLKRIAGLAAVAAAPSAATGWAAQGWARLEIFPDRRILDIPADFTGLSYETAQLADPRFFSPQNELLIRLLRTLGSRGVLRLGGNTSEFALWAPQGSTPQTEAAKAAQAKREAWTQPPSLITPEGIRNLAGFAEAAGWALIWGLNLGKGSASDAAEEAACVTKYAGRRLVAFQIGNEPDLYRNNGLRPRGWGFGDYLKQWREYAQAVRRRVPHAKFAAPDVAFRADWITAFAAQASDQVIMLTGHYYAEGPPTDPRMTLARLLRPNPRLESDIPKIMNAAHQARLPFRMAELNSCYQGGKPGVSNTLGSAVWGADLMLHLAQAGYAGVNFHGGSRSVIKTGLGGILPGASLAPDESDKYPGAFYTPIAGNLEVGFAARPLFYGMLLAGQLAGATMVESKLDAAGSNVTAYAARAPGGLRVAVVNRDLEATAHVAIDPGRTWHHARFWRLTGPSPDSTEGITLAGAEVGHAGEWRPVREEALTATEKGYVIALQPSSAGLAFFQD